MFSTDFIFRQQENLVDNQKCQAGFRPLCNKILLICNWFMGSGSNNLLNMDEPDGQISQLLHNIA